MVLSRDLIISLGFTLVIAVLLFFFIKQRTSVVEDKINTLIQFVQEETAQRRINTVSEPVNDIQVYESQQELNETSQNADRIVVSDDEEDYETDSDSSEYTDGSSSDSDDESVIEAEPEHVSHIDDTSAQVEQEVKEHIKSVTLTSNNANDTSNLINLSTQSVTPVVDTINVEATETTESDASPTVLEQMQFNVTTSESTTETTAVTGAPEEDDEDADVVEQNYSKLKVHELRDIITQRGLASELNVKTLKKKELVSILEEASTV